MGWNVNSLVFLLGLPMVGVCATALYLLYSKDDNDELEDPILVNNRICKPVIRFIEIPKESVGVVIGRAGNNIKEIELHSHAKINFKDELDDEKFRICIIRGTADAVKVAETMINDTIRNQPVVETHEIWVPEKLVGRIIGVGGTNIKTISRSSNARIRIDRNVSEKDTNRKIIIKGTANQITIAKTLIEEKVLEDAEARRVAEMSAANRSPRSKNNFATPENKNKLAVATSDCIDEMKDNSFEKFLAVNNDAFLEVFVSSVINPSKFWVQVISPKSTELDHLVEQMTEYYRLEENQNLHQLNEATVGQMVAAPFEYDDKWYRSEILSITEDENDKMNSQLVLYYVDYGDTDTVYLRDVLQLRMDFLKLRFQAIECSLAGVKPSGEVWTEESVDVFQELCHVALWRPMRAHIVNYKDNGEGSPVPRIELFDASDAKDIDVRKELVSKGFAVFDEDNSETTSVSLENNSLDNKQ